MAPKSYSFQGQLAVGALGVQLAVRILKSKYPNIENLEDDRAMQKRGVDLRVGGLGLVEVKTDTHKPVNAYFELDSGTRPGAIDRSVADYICYVYCQHDVLYLFKRDELNHWMRERYKIARKKDIKRVGTTAGEKSWTARGLLAPLKDAVLGMKSTVQVTWKGDDIAWK